MKKTALLALLLACGIAQADSLKAGLWQVTITKRLRDGQDMTDKTVQQQERMKAALEKMPPEQREKLQAMMAKRGITSDGNGARVCISPAMAAGDKPYVDPQAGCDPAKVSRGGNSLTYEFSCNRNGRASTGTGKTTFSGNTATTVIDSASKEADGSAHTMHVETAMQYVGSDCQGIKPLDQASRDAQKSP